MTRATPANIFRMLPMPIPIRTYFKLVFIQGFSAEPLALPLTSLIVF